MADEQQPARPWEVLGAHLRRVGGTDGVAFSVWAPNAHRVSVTGAFCNWHPDAVPMTMRDDGIWEGFVPGVTAGERYRYVVGGADGRTRHKSDPYGQSMDLPPGSASHVPAPSTHAWSDDDWLAQRPLRDLHRSPMRIYEVHLGSWRRGPRGRFLTYAEIGPRLADHCARHGFTHVELLPLAEHPFYASWGYQVTAFHAPTARYGTPDQLRGMVDLLHRSRIGVILDWVPAHFASDGYGLVRFDGTHLYEDPDPQRRDHPEWGSLVFNFGRAEVREFLIGNARYWLEEFHADGLRVDAVASMLYLDYARRRGQWTPNIHGGNHNLEAIAFLRELNTRCRIGLPGVITVAEESTDFDGVSRPVAEGGLGFDLKWDLGWMHDTLVYFHKRPDRRRLHRREITFRGFYLDNERWILPLSHDEVVHGKGTLLGKMPGRGRQQFASLRSLVANQLGQPGKKLLFMGTELAPEREWDHDRELLWREAEADAARLGFARLLDDLAALYHASPSLWAGDGDPGGFSWIDGEGTTDPSVVAWVRRGALPEMPEEVTVVVQNGAATARHGYRLGLPVSGPWDEVLNTDSEHYGGTNVGNGGAVLAEPRPWGGHPASALVTLPPRGTLFLRPSAG
ncbi:MAG TPA: 1,4-alpha-glucan branching protein GlgB [Candidatus Limnocylindria bacterium]|jgi:1,4-alpha-glucan branching enzyme|nr:1,4-alpha-glucan branching protein GlgB [Candidatus Limnocylindria bacterium]